MPFAKNDPRIYKGGRPRKKRLEDILEGMGAQIVGPDGKTIDTAGDETLLRNIVDVAIKEKNPAMMKFIYQHTNAPQSDPELVQIKKQSERARAAKLEIANGRARGELVSRGLVVTVFSKIYAIHQSNFLSIGPTSAGNIAAEAGIKDDAVRLKIEELVTRDTYQALSAIKREINDFLVSMGTQKIEEPPVPEIRKKRTTNRHG